MQRVRQRADEPMPGPGGKLRVQIQRDDVPNVVEKMQITRFDREFVVLMEQETIEVQKLAALSLPSHPEPFVLVVFPMPMKMEQSALLFGRVSLVKVLDQ